MCGICGVFSVRETLGVTREITSKMTQLLHHRGPDASEIWSDTRGLGLGHCRLSIVDLSNAGSQPMLSNSGRWVISYNGEIYNHKILREKLSAQGVRFQGQSDTEVLLESIDQFGLISALESAKGMFAFALWDREDRVLTLARDRFGEKPLYYGLIGKDLVFASELKALKAHPEFNFDIDPISLSGFMKYGYVQGENCIFKGFKKLKASSYVSGKTAEDVFNSTPTVFWSPKTEELEPGNLELEKTLNEVVSQQMVSDVPTGCFLSGGVDSSLVASLMQNQSSQPIKTFTIGFEDPEFDESVYAAKVAKELGTNHTEWIIDEADVLNLVPSLPVIYDEPFADSSQLPTSLLCKLTRKDVTVCLSGDGGDELFHGYTRYPKIAKIGKYLNAIPEPVRKTVLHILSLKEPHDWARMAHKISGSELKILEARFGWLLEILSKDGILKAYDLIMSHWYYPSQIVLDGKDVTNFVSGFNDELSTVENIMRHDAQTYLINDIMVKVDRAAMASSLESRAPLLDGRVADIAFSMPLEEKLKGGINKAPLKEILYKYVSKDLIERPKKGFGVPLESWFRNELHDWVCDTLAPDKITRQGILDPVLVEQCRSDHIAGKENNQYKLWDLVVFQQWYDKWNS